MIIRIQANGGSFRGAGLYYLHDKSADPTLEKNLKPKTDERVWFTDTRNCLNIDPGRALEEMWHTAEDQAFLKMQAGVKRGGRVCEDPTKTLSMSWHKDDKPTPEHMVESADALLKHMGWEAHQAVYVGHNDTEHRHIHIILNRVNPENGRTLDDFREQKRAQSWALQYEREQDHVRCEQREINAEREAGRANRSQLDKTAANERSPGLPQEYSAAVASMDAAVLGRPANDHLPHNVVMLSRPHEREFKDHELLRQAHAPDLGADQTADQKAELKQRQRAEREAFFKDGAKLFKATRHAVYDEVRQDYKAEWRQFYQDRNAATKSAEASSETALGRAFHFARVGHWDAAREAFNERDSVRDAVSKEFDERRSGLKSRQTEDLRERQRDAYDALRDVRDVQYQELLQRQRDERAALVTGQTLQSIGHGTQRETGQEIQTLPQPAANENHQPQVSETGPRPLERAAPNQSAVERPNAEQSEPVFRPLDEALRSQTGGFIELPHIEMPKPEEIAPARGVTDLAAAGIGSVASYLADQLGEFFAPTPPEVREAQSKADAKQAAEQVSVKPDPNDKAATYARMIDSAVQLVEAERAQQDSAYWKERDRGKDFERDQ